MRIGEGEGARSKGDRGNSGVTIVAGVFSPTRHMALVFMGFHILRVTHATRSFFSSLPLEASTRRIVPVFEKRRTRLLSFQSRRWIRSKRDSVYDSSLLLLPRLSFSPSLPFSRLSYPASLAAASRPPDASKSRRGGAIDRLYGASTVGFPGRCDFRRVAAPPRRNRRRRRRCPSRRFYFARAESGTPT